jgi:hypothetical protein
MVKMPMGSFWKSTTTEKLKEVVGIYEATIETAELSPLMILALRTSLQLFEQSLADCTRERGR